MAHVDLGMLQETEHQGLQNLWVRVQRLSDDHKRATAPLSVHKMITRFALNYSKNNALKVLYLNECLWRQFPREIPT